MSSLRIEDLDRSLRKCFAACAGPGMNSMQRDKASSELKKLTKEAESFGLAEEIRGIGEFLLTRDRLRELNQPIEFPIAQFLELGRRSLKESLQFGVSDTPEAFAALPVDVLLEAGSSPLFFEKIANKRPQLLHEVVAAVLSFPEIDFSSGGLLWIVKKARIEQLFPLLPLMFDRNGDSSGPMQELRKQLLAKDKTGKGLSRILTHIADGEFSPQSLVEVLRVCPEGAVAFIKALPKLLSKNYGVYAVTVIEEWIVFLPQTPRRKRSAVSGSLVSLVGWLVQKSKRNALEESVLTIVTSAMKQLSLQVGADVDGIWCVSSLEDNKATEGGCRLLTMEGARLIVESLEKVDDARYEPSEIWKALAVNIGLVSVGSFGERVAFDPKQHEDSVGGILRGDSVAVLRSGWRFNDAVLLKAKVKPETIHA